MRTFKMTGWRTNRDRTYFAKWEVYQISKESIETTCDYEEYNIQRCGSDRVIDREAHQKTFESYIGQYSARMIKFDINGYPIWCDDMILFGVYDDNIGDIKTIKKSMNRYLLNFFKKNIDYPPFETN